MVIVEVEVQHIGVKMLRSALLFLCEKAENCFGSIVSSGFTLELSQSRGAFLQAVQACGASGSVGGGSAHTNKVLDFRLQRLSHSNTKVLLIKSASC